MQDQKARKDRKVTLVSQVKMVSKDLQGPRESKVSQVHQASRGHRESGEK